MAEHQGKTQKNTETTEHKNRNRTQESQTSDFVHDVSGPNPVKLTETPFWPRMDEHAKLLDMTYSDEQRANFVMQLQHTYGNRYVQRLIESKRVQAKLTVNSPDDTYEQEADRVAHAVVNNTHPQAQRQDIQEELQAKPVLQRQDIPEEEEEIQAKPVLQRQDTKTVPEIEPEIEHNINNVKSNGRPLDDNVRAPMEQAFNIDFSGVRIHTDSESDMLNKSLNAKAFTTGHDVFFRENEYSPGSDNGRELIAHELTHVVQQSGNSLMRTLSRTRVQRIWNPFKRKPKISAPKDVKNTTSASQIMQAVEAANPRALAAMSQNRKFLGQMEAVLSQEEYDKASFRIELGVAVWVWEAILKLQMNILLSINEWVLLKKVASKDDYMTAVKAFDSFSGDAAAKEQFLKSIPNDKLYLFSDLIPKQEKKPTDKPIEEQIKTTANPKRAETALAELKTMQAIDEKSKSRLTDAIIELLVWGVAKPRSTDAVGGEGIIGIEHAVNAAEALIAMKLPAYLDIVMKLALTGGDKNTWDQQQVESVLILKAVAARKSKYQADEKKAKEDVSTFAEGIRGQDLEELKKATSTRDIGGGTGLQQRFTMSCGPTSIQIIRGESDPVYAMDISTTGKHTTEYKSKVAQEQKSIMGKDLIPREVMDDWKAFQGKINGLDVSAGTDVLKWQALLKYIEGKNFNARLKNEGVALANAQGFSNERLDEFRQYYPFNEPGLSWNEWVTKAQAQLSGVIGPSNPHSFPGGVTNNHLNDVWKSLFRGRDVGIAVLWPQGGGHVMVFSDCKGTPPTGGAGRSFLLSDPWEGTSEWLTDAQVTGGQLGTHGQGKVAFTFF
jgi:hypothetical protein